VDIFLGHRVYIAEVHINENTVNAGFVYRAGNR